VARIAPIIQETPWGDIEGSIRAIDFFISRLEFVLAPQFRELAAVEGWPAWLDGRVSDEGCVDPERLSDAETLLLVAALVHDIKVNCSPPDALATSPGAYYRPAARNRRVRCDFVTLMAGSISACLCAARTPRQWFSRTNASVGAPGHPQAPVLTSVQR
jgi:hypothetical protein